MTLSTLRPNGTTSNDGTVTGASAHAALSDESDATFVEFDLGEFAVLTLTDFTLPSGAVVARVELWARDARTSGTPIESLQLRGIDPEFFGSSSVSWLTATDHLAASKSFSYADAALDAASLDVFSGEGSLRVFEAYVKVFYATQPTLTVDSPTGTITTSNPSASWTPTLDSDGGPQTHVHGKIFNDTQYLAPGFDPDTSEAVLDAGEVAFSGTESAPVSDPLPDDDYRWYVKAAQTINGERHRSEWAFTSFTVNATTPDNPVSVTATAQADEGRVQIDVDATSGVNSSDWAEVERSTDAGTTWTAIRRREFDSALSAPYFLVDTVDDSVRAWDYEAPNGTAATYRARTVHIDPGTTTVLGKSDYVESSPVTWDTTQWWLKAADGTHLAVTIRSFPEVQRQARQGVFNVLGRSTPVVISDARASYTGAVTLIAETDSERQSLDVLLDKSLPLLLQAPDEDHWPPAGEDNVIYVAMGNLTRARAFDASFAAITFEALEFTVVDTPSQTLVTDHPQADA